MHTKTKTRSDLVLSELGDGLIMRRSTRADADALAEFNAAIHAEPDIPKDGLRVAAWARDLLTSDHPTFGSWDYTIVE